MFNKMSTEELKQSRNTDSQRISSKPFYAKQQKQLESFSTVIALQDVNFSSLSEIPGFYSDLISLNKKISEERKQILVSQLKRRIEHAQAIVYRKNEITKEFLSTINDDKSDKNFLDKISSARAEISSKNPVNKNILNNYLRILKPKDEKEMQTLIAKDINHFFQKRKKEQSLATTIS